MGSKLSVFEIMACCRIGDKPLSETWTTQICHTYGVVRPRWDNRIGRNIGSFYPRKQRVRVSFDAEAPDNFHSDQFSTESRDLESSRDLMDIRLPAYWIEGQTDAIRISWILWHHNLQTLPHNWPSVRGIVYQRVSLTRPIMRALLFSLV